MIWMLQDYCGAVARFRQEWMPFYDRGGGREGLGRPQPARALSAGQPRFKHALEGVCLGVLIDV